MAPDLNSLPPSHSPDAVLASRHRTISNGGDSSPSRRSSTVSLQAAATINAGMQSQDPQRSSPGSTRARGSPQLSRPERRRSNVAMTLNLNDPALPGPGELQGGGRRLSQTLYRTNSQSMGTSPGPVSGDPHHHQRAPSLGELHQELEQEQEAQVNRLLQMIRQQQIQLQNLQTQNTSAAAIVEDSTPTSERSMSLVAPNPTAPVQVPAPVGARTRSPAARASNEISRRSSYRSRRSSRDSPSLQPLVAGMQVQEEAAASRDEVSFYQAETQNLTRENQMLRVRIRELERQLSDVQSTPANAPSTPSNLTAPPMEAEEDQGQREDQGQQQQAPQQQQEPEPERESASHALAPSSASVATSASVSANDGAAPSASTSMEENKS